LTLAGVVKEDLTCSGSSLPEATSDKRQATSDKQQATCGNMDNLKIYKKIYNYRIN
jgi:BioD-like phosphotransacetylase family protein